MTFTPITILTVLCVLCLLIGGHVYTAIKHYICKGNSKLRAVKYTIVAGAALLSTTAVAANFILEITKL